MAGDTGYALDVLPEDTGSLWIDHGTDAKDYWIHPGLPGNTEYTVELILGILDTLCSRIREIRDTV